MIAELGHFSLILALIAAPDPRFSSLGGYRIRRAQLG